MESTRETNLERILREKKLSVAAVSAVIGVSQPQSTRRKLSKERPFKLGEAMHIHKDLLPEYDFNFLFDEYGDIPDEEE